MTGTAPTLVVVLRARPVDVRQLAARPRGARLEQAPRARFDSLPDEGLNRSLEGDLGAAVEASRASAARQRPGSR